MGCARKSIDLKLFITLSLMTIGCAVLSTMWKIVIPPIYIKIRNSCQDLLIDQYDV